MFLLRVKLWASRMWVHPHAVHLSDETMLDDSERHKTEEL